MQIKYTLINTKGIGNNCWPVMTTPLFYKMEGNDRAKLPKIVAIEQTHKHIHSVASK